jgi:hypothetical protein
MPRQSRTCRTHLLKNFHGRGCSQELPYSTGFGPGSPWKIIREPWSPIQSKCRYKIAECRGEGYGTEKGSLVSVYMVHGLLDCHFQKRSPSSAPLRQCAGSHNSWLPLQVETGAWEPLQHPSLCCIFPAFLHPYGLAQLCVRAGTPPTPSSKRVSSPSLFPLKAGILGFLLKCVAPLVESITLTDMLHLSSHK